MTEHLIPCEGSGHDGQLTQLGTLACRMCGGQLLSLTLELPQHHRHDRHHDEDEYLHDARIRNQFETAHTDNDIQEPTQ